MCYEEGVLQAYLDRETTLEERQLIEQHLAVCSHCRLAADKLEENDNFVKLHLTTYKRQIDRIEPVLDSKFANGPDREHHIKTKGVFGLLRAYRKLAAAVAAVAFLGILLSFAPVRAVAAQFLTLFRVQKIETVGISAEDLNRIQRAFYDQSGKLDISNFGKLENTREGEFSRVGFAEAQEAMGFDLQMPSHLPEGMSFSEEFFLEPANRIDLTLDVTNVNAVIKQLGGSHLLPENLDGKTFTLSLAQAIKAGAAAGEGKDGKSLYYTQTRSPELRVPEDSDVNEVRKAILDLPVIPEDIRRKLASLENWQNTLYVPQPPNGTAEEVDINGAGGVIIKETRGSGIEKNILMWQNDGLFYVLEGRNIAAAELIKTAASVK